jgi:hypothetical protein
MLKKQMQQDSVNKCWINSKLDKLSWSKGESSKFKIFCGGDSSGGAGDWTPYFAHAKHGFYHQATTLVKLRIIFSFLFLEVLGFEQGPCACWAGAVPLETLHQPQTSNSWTKIRCLGRATVAHICNPSYSRGREQEARFEDNKGK